MSKVIRDKVRTRWDFLMYVCKKSILSSILYLLGLLLAILGLFLTPFILDLGLIVSFAGVILAIAGLFRDWHDFKKHEKYKLISKYGFSTDNISMCESDVLNDRKKIGEYIRVKVILNEYENNSQYIFMSHKLNKYLWRSSNRLVLEFNDVKDAHISNIIKENWESLSHYLKHNTAIALSKDKAFYNEKNYV